MLTNNKVLFLLIVFSHLNIYQSLAIEKDTSILDKVHFSAELLGSKFVVGEPIIINLQVKNTSNDTLKLNFCSAFGAYDYFHKSSKETLFLNLMRGDTTKGGKHAYTFKINPKSSSRVSQIDLNVKFQKSLDNRGSLSVGHHQMYIVYEVLENVFIKSNVFSFEIKHPEDHQLDQWNDFINSYHREQLEFEELKKKLKDFRSNNYLYEYFLFLKAMKYYRARGSNYKYAMILLKTLVEETNNSYLREVSLRTIFRLYIFELNPEEARIWLNKSQDLNKEKYLKGIRLTELYIKLNKN